MKARTLRLAHELYSFTCTADSFLHEGEAASPYGHSSGGYHYLWFRACCLAAALTDDETPEMTQLPARPHT